MRFFTVFFAAVVMAVAAPTGTAQTSRELAEKHPAAQVVVTFLRYSVNRDYEKAADLIQPASLETLRKDYLAKVKNPRVALDEASAMCRAVGVADERGIEAMTPRQFYAAYNKGMQRRYNVTDEVNRRIADSLELNMLSVAEEGPALVHFLVRTEHQTMANEVRHLEIISLVRTDSQWLVSLGEQEPKYKPLASTPKPAAPATPASAPATPPATTPDTPAKTPVPAPAPTPKPTPK
jgi:hypothetical protein